MDTDKVKRDVAYEIEDVVLFEPFKVYKSANAWWMKEIKVQYLMEGFKKGYNIKDALILAGISEIQYKYFLKIHPEFYMVKQRCEDGGVSIVARETIFRAIQTDWRAAFRFLEKKCPEEFGKKINNF
jgi:hypothetical protein